jgi:hypothetical protein
MAVSASAQKRGSRVLECVTNVLNGIQLWVAKVSLFCAPKQAYLVLPSKRRGIENDCVLEKSAPTCARAVGQWRLSRRPFSGGNQRQRRRPGGGAEHAQERSGAASCQVPACAMPVSAMCVATQVCTVQQRMPSTAKDTKNARADADSSLTFAFFVSLVVRSFFAIAIRRGKPPGIKWP